MAFLPAANLAIASRLAFQFVGRHVFPVRAEGLDVKRDCGSQASEVIAFTPMRRLQAIALVIVLAAAPMALVAGAWKCACSPEYCTMACCRHGKCMTNRQSRCPGSREILECDCMRFPTFAMLAPITQMILPHPVSLPAIERPLPDSPAVALVVLPGFFPAPFHPPRG